MMCWLAYRESYGARVEQLQPAGGTQALKVGSVKSQDGIDAVNNCHRHQPGIVDVLAQNLRLRDDGFPVRKHVRCVG